MRDALKVVIGFGVIWGLFAGGFVLLSSFNFGANDSTPEVIALTLYGVTLLPSCILAIWYQKQAALWLMFVSAVSVFGLAYQLVSKGTNGEHFVQLVASTVWIVSLCAVPALLGYFLLRLRPAVRNRT